MINVFKKPIPKNASIRFLPVQEDYTDLVMEQERIKDFEKRWNEMKGKCPFCKKEKVS